MVLISFSSLLKAQPCTTNLAVGMSATSSSASGGNLAGNATDGNLGSRWESLYTDPQQITIDLGAPVNICKIILRWENAAGKDFTVQVSADGVTWTTVATVTNNAVLVNTFTFSQTARWARMNGTARTTAYGFSLFEFEVYGSVVTPCTGSNVALGKTASASSVSGGNAASNAIDNNGSTRWESVSSDPQFLSVDLGGLYNICKVNLTWEAAYGRNFLIQFSTNGSTWTTAYSFVENVSLSNSIPVSGTARYVRMYGTTRASVYGYSLYEFGIIGTNASLPLAVTGFHASANGTAVMLNWKIEDPGVYDSVVVERKLPGERVFTSLVKLSASSSTGWTDKKAGDGMNTYRLRVGRESSQVILSREITVVVNSDNTSPRLIWKVQGGGRIIVEGVRGLPVKILGVYDLSGIAQRYTVNNHGNQSEILLCDIRPKMLIVRAQGESRIVNGE